MKSHFALAFSSCVIAAAVGTTCKDVNGNNYCCQEGSLNMVMNFGNGFDGSLPKYDRTCEINGKETGKCTVNGNNQPPPDSKPDEMNPPVSTSSPTVPAAADNCSNVNGKSYCCTVGSPKTIIDFGTGFDDAESKVDCTCEKDSKEIGKCTVKGKGENQATQDNLKPDEVTPQVRTPPPTVPAAADNCSDVNGKSYCCTVGSPNTIIDFGNGFDDAESKVNCTCENDSEEIGKCTVKDENQSGTNVVRRLRGSTM